MGRVRSNLGVCRWRRSAGHGLDAWLDESPGPVRRATEAATQGEHRKNESLDGCRSFSRIRDPAEPAIAQRVSVFGLFSERFQLVRLVVQQQPGPGAVSAGASEKCSPWRESMPSKPKTAGTPANAVWHVLFVQSKERGGYRS